ncbi:hypothetical protein [uncultured Alteromonas sp.]|uniref:hypothetical protein n=1 Tax=uncultured Alteromonas sp. TaxID=179113 RepID=UPI0025D62C8A|nr:hypothetical protein [uncultured Alteromonas sp.]
MLAFFPNLGSMPVSPDQNVSVILNNDHFHEGPAGDFQWQEGSSDSVQGWREMQPGEVLHSEHRLPNRRGNIRIQRGNDHAHG